MIFTACLSTHWTAHIKMCYFQQVAILFHLTENEAFQSSCPCGMICISQVIQNQTIHLHGVSSCVYTNRHGSHVSNFSKMSESKDPSTWSFFMRSYTNMTYMAVPQVGGTILYLFGMNMCITTIEIHFRCKTIEGIIQINRVTIILLK